MTTYSKELSGLPPRLGRYELVRVLGRGGMGRVVLGRDPVLHREVALKLVEPSAVEEGDLAELRFMFHREARATAALHHPNIVEVFDYSGPDADVLFLACELIAGSTLRDVLDERDRLGASLVAACGYELAQALAHAHANGIVHRDIKPENVFWTEAGRIVMSDFGIAKAFASPARLGGTVQFGATNLYGSPAYMAPEQLAGGAVGPHTDLFALGALLFEALAGHAAFGGSDVQAILEAVQAGHRASLPPNVVAPAALLALIDQLLALEPGRRPASAAAVASALRAVLDEIGVTDPRLVLVGFGADAPTYRPAGRFVPRAEQGAVTEPIRPAAWRSPPRASLWPSCIAPAGRAPAPRTCPGRSISAARPRSGSMARAPARSAASRSCRSPPARTASRYVAPTPRCSASWSWCLTRRPCFASKRAQRSVR